VERAMDVRAMQMQASDPMLSAQILEQKAQVEKARAELTDQLQGRMIQQQDVNVPDQVIPGQLIRPASGGNTVWESLTPEERKEVQEIEKETKDYAAALTALQQAKDSMAGTGGAGLGIFGRRVPDDVAGGDARTNRSRIYSALALSAKALGFSREETNRYIENQMSSSTVEDVQGGLADAEAQVRANALGTVRTKSPRSQAAYRQLRPEIFAPTTETKRPGQ